MRDKNKKFSVGDGGDIEQNIKKLQKELGDMLLKGAPEIEGVPVDEEIKRIKPEERKVEKQEKKATVLPENRYTMHYDKPTEPYKETFGLFKNRRFYIVVFGVVALMFILIKTPVFRYTTPMRPDNDLPGIKVGFKYYNNILGQQTRNKTIINIGKERMVVPISMEKWFNLDKERKLMVIEYYRNQ